MGVRARYEYGKLLDRYDADQAQADVLTNGERAWDGTISGDPQSMLTDDIQNLFGGYVHCVNCSDPLETSRSIHRHMLTGEQACDTCHDVWVVLEKEFEQAELERYC